MIRVGTEDTRTWRVGYRSSSGELDSYSMDALRAEVTDGGVLVFTNFLGNIAMAISPSGWDSVEPT